MPKCQNKDCGRYYDIVEYHKVDVPGINGLAQWITGWTNHFYCSVSCCYVRQEEVRQANARYEDREDY